MTHACYIRVPYHKILHAVIVNYFFVQNGVTPKNDLKRLIVFFSLRPRLRLLCKDIAVCKNVSGETCSIF